MSMPAPALSPSTAHSLATSTTEVHEDQDIEPGHGTCRISDESQTLHSPSPRSSKSETSNEDVGPADSPTMHRFSGRSASQGSRAQRRSNLDPYMIPLTHRQPRPKSTLDLLIDLDSRTGVGLTLYQFNSLFTRCSCGRVTTGRSFVYHECLEVIDLTIDED